MKINEDDDKQNYQDMNKMMKINFSRLFTFLIIRNMNNMMKIKFFLIFSISFLFFKFFNWTYTAWLFHFFLK